MEADKVSGLLDLNLALEKLLWIECPSGNYVEC